MNRPIALTLVCVSFVFAACKSKRAESETPSEKAAVENGKEGPAHVELPTKVHLSDDVVKNAKIQTTPVTTEILPVTVDLTGEVTFDPDHAAMITARAPGRIVDVRFKEGERVKQGALLVVIESPELARARAAYTTTMSRSKTARQNADRLAALSQKGLASGQEVAVANMEASVAESEATAASQALAAFGPGAHELGDAGARLSIFSPLDGYILTRNALRGQTVPADHLLTTVANFDHAYFLARLFEKDLAHTAVGSTAEVRLNAYTAIVFTGKVESIGRQLDPTARTVVARVAIENRDDLLKAGLFGSVRLSMGKGTDLQKSLVVPLSAVTRMGDRDVVFVREDNGDFDIHPVTLGRSAEGKVQVLAGLNASEQVVHDGVFVLKSAALKSTFGEED